MCLELSARKYLIFIIDDVGDQVSPIISLFCKYPLTTVLNFKFSGLPLDYIFSLHTSMNGVTGSPFLGYYIIKVWLLIIFLIYFKIYFSQSLLTSFGNLATSAKFLGSGMKWDTSEPDSPKVVNELFNYFTKTLKIFCKPLTIIFSESSNPFH